LNYLSTQCWYSDLSAAEPNPGKGDLMICHVRGEISVLPPVQIDRIIGQKFANETRSCLMQTIHEGRVLFSWGRADCISWDGAETCPI
jgi:hypothetical protein